MIIKSPLAPDYYGYIEVKRVTDSKSQGQILPYEVGDVIYNRIIDHPSTLSHYQFIAFKAKKDTSLWSYIHPGQDNIGDLFEISRNELEIRLNDAMIRPFILKSERPSEFSWMGIDTFEISSSFYEPDNNTNGVEVPNAGIF